MSSRHDIIPFIRNRSSVEPIKLSLSGILKINGMEQYLLLCSDRIASAELIDGEDVEIDFVNFPDLILSENGIFICRKILAGYTGEEGLINLWHWTIEENEIRRLMNQYLEILRGMERKELRKILRGAKPAIQVHEQIAEKVREQCREELKSRCLINRIRIFLMKYFLEIYIRIKYAGLISVLKECTNETMKNHGSGGGRDA